MTGRNRNAAILFIVIGVVLLVGSKIGFFTIISLFLIWYGIRKMQENQEKQGYILIGIGAFLLLSEHLLFLITIILISLGYFYVKTKRDRLSGQFLHKQSLWESVRWNREPWVLKNTSMWFVLGEVTIDLSLALMEEKETTLILQGVIGDIDIIAPEEIGISIHSSVLFGQLHVGKEKEKGILNKIVWQSPEFAAAEQKVHLKLVYVVGDVDVRIL